MVNKKSESEIDEFTKHNIKKEIYHWISKNDCRSAMIVRQYAEKRYTNWLPVLNERKFYHWLTFYIHSRNQGQRQRKIKAPEGMTLYCKGGGMLLPDEIKIDDNKTI